MAKRERNWEALPLMDNEGIFLRKIPIDFEVKERGIDEDDEETQRPGYVKPHWTEGLTPWQRLYSHHTLASIRQSKRFYRPFLIRDDLDFILASTYQHDVDIFPEKVDTVLQPETQGIETWRTLRNQVVIPPPIIIPRGHPCKFGGIQERKSIHAVKLGIGSFHSAQTNSGYSRKEDGTLYAV